MTKRHLVNYNQVKNSFLRLCCDGVQKVKIEGCCVLVLPGCEVEILRVRPSFCEKYVYNPSEKNLTNAITNALQVLR